jgi:chaperonin cofactor prefoldin
MNTPEIHIHLHSVSDEKINKILHNTERLMTSAAELKQELVEANAATNELASDVDDLMAKVGEGSLSPAEADEVKTQLTALKESLKAVAAKHTPGTAT